MRGVGACNPLADATSVMQSLHRVHVENVVHVKESTKIHRRRTREILSKIVQEEIAPIQHEIQTHRRHWGVFNHHRLLALGAHVLL